MKKLTLVLLILLASCTTRDFADYDYHPTMKTYDDTTNGVRCYWMSFMKDAIACVKVK